VVLQGYANPTLDALTDQQLVAFDDQSRREILSEIQSVIAEDLPVYTLYNKTGYAVYKPATYDGWMYMYDHQWPYHSKLSYLER
jgi:peptide/nickel transport system substrate-binding protein